ncbi:hypothetical protein MHYP_G00072000 [Metynnis hypsauchen]
MKTNFQTVLFTDECRATLDGPDGWSTGWFADGHHVATRLRCQQGVVFGAGIMGRELVGPFRIPEGACNRKKSHSRQVYRSSYPALSPCISLTWVKSGLTGFGEVTGEDLHFVPSSGRARHSQAVSQPWNITLLTRASLTHLAGARKGTPRPMTWASAGLQPPPRFNSALSGPSQPLTWSNEMAWMSSNNMTGCSALCRKYVSELAVWGCDQKMRPEEWALCA